MTAEKRTIARARELTRWLKLKNDNSDLDKFQQCSAERRDHSCGALSSMLQALRSMWHGLTESLIVYEVALLVQIMAWADLNN